MSERHRKILTLSTTPWEWDEWQLPTAYLSQSPSEFPKLANTILEIFFPKGQLSWTVGFLPNFCISVSPLCRCLNQELNGGRCELVTWPHTFLIAIVSTVMPRGLPFSSSSRTNRLPVGFKKPRGTWYLKAGACQQVIYGSELIPLMWEIREAGSSCFNNLLWTIVKVN